MSPVSIAVNTFSTRLGSRRNQRRPTRNALKDHGNATIETIRIGHMIGPPLLKLSMKKFLLSGAASVGIAVAPGAPGAALAPGAPGAALAAGAAAAGAVATGTAGEVVTAGIAPAAAGDIAVSAVAPGAAAVPASGATDRAGDAAVSAGAFKSGLPAGEAAGF